MSSGTTTIGKFVWHEQVSPQPEQAQGFYTQLFGWDTDVMHSDMGDYTMISSGGTSHGGFGTAAEGAPPPHWLSHVHVERLEDTIEKATAAGGRVAAGPFEMGDVGRMVIIVDPQGAYLSAYQPGGAGGAPQGVFVWDELSTSDADGAQRFYEAVFGWTTSDMGDEYGGYRIFNVGEAGIAGVMQASDIPPHWHPYVAVDDPDAIVARAGELGGSTLAEPMDVPDVGRIAVLSDPQGAVFGIIRPQPPEE